MADVRLCRKMIHLMQCAWSEVANIQVDLHKGIKHHPRDDCSVLLLSSARQPFRSKYDDFCLDIQSEVLEFLDEEDASA